jgi:hypothetical protein
VGALAHAECYRLPFLTAEGRGDGGALDEHEGLAVTNATLTSLRRREGRREARVVNETGASVSAGVGDETLELRPWEIRTVAV